MVKAVLSDFSYVLATPKNNNWDFNQKLLDFYQELKQNQIKINIFTASSATELIAVRQKLEPIINKIFSSKQHNLNKTEVKSFNKIAAELNLKPEEIVFIDDQLVNIEVAKEAGYKIIYHTKTDDTVKKLWGLVHVGNPNHPRGDV
jgi:HAD superfamily hydrolase (TIGR01509 family)